MQMPNMQAGGYFEPPDDKVTCDVCGVEKWADAVDFVPAHAAGSAQCDTNICEDCIDDA